VTGTRLALPIDDHLPDACAALADAGGLVLCAPPGAGKTTRVPPALLDAGLAGTRKILVLQPRRVAAKATAARMAQERHCPLGQQIGYQVRFESRCSSATRIAVVTEGILLRRLLDDPFLEDVGLIVFDEFHERSLASDLALAMVRQVQGSVRPDLKIVVMSATLAPQAVAEYLGGVPVLKCPGHTFPVTIRYLRDWSGRPLVDDVVAAVPELFEETEGDLLVFLPGVHEIRQCRRRLADWADSRGIELAMLYGDLPLHEQTAVLARALRRRVILATNVAETSLTVEGVTAVVDSGWQYLAGYDARTGLDRLQRVPISQASADQRAGRAGRTGPGLCLRLWPEAIHRSRPPATAPEIQRVDLAGAVLHVLCWIEPDLERFPWFEPPAPAALDRALRLLTQLGAVRDRQVTELGRHLAAMPVHPRLARLLWEGRRLGCVEETALAAALLAERDPFQRAAVESQAPTADRSLGSRPARHVPSRSDILDRVRAFQVAAQAGFPQQGRHVLKRGAAQHIQRVSRQLAELASEAAARDDSGTLASPSPSVTRPARSTDENALLRALLAAYPDRLARRREAGSRRGIMVGGRGVRLADESALGDEPLFLCIEVDDRGSETLVRQASAVERDWLPAEQLRVESSVTFDPTSGKVLARRRVLWQDLVLEESPQALPDPAQAAQVLAVAAAERLDEVFPADDPQVAGFRARVQCLRQWMPQLDLPPLDDAQLRGLVAELSAGKRSLAELRQADWLSAMQSLLTWPQREALQREAPPKIELPSGRTVPLRYEVGRPPILAAPIQELFGMLHTPRIAGGRIKVLIHLLAPNQRVAQVTDDLEHFWKSSYTLVRKELRGRYPKHAWPEDPLTAVAQPFGRGRR
jgi:ATP-dependent helicase HrpB